MGNWASSWSARVAEAGTRAGVYDAQTVAALRKLWRRHSGCYLPVRQSAWPPRCVCGRRNYESWGRAQSAQDQAHGRDLARSVGGEIAGGDSRRHSPAFRTVEPSLRTVAEASLSSATGRCGCECAGSLNRLTMR